jgi:chemotaxis protein MotB
MLLFLVLIVGLSSCVSSKKYKAMEDEKNALESSLEQQKAENKELKETKMALEADKAMLDKKVAKLESDMEATKDKLEEAKEFESELKKIKMELATSFAAANKSGLKMESKDGRLYVSFPNAILYAPGSATVSKDGRKILDSLSTIFKNNPGLQILVEGHTDADPIVHSANRYTDNWDLSMQRSVRVTRELIKRGVAGDQLTAAGRAQFSPLGKDAPKKQNRRTEFVVFPKVGNLHMYSK